MRPEIQDLDEIGPARHEDEPGEAGVVHQQEAAEAEVADGERIGLELGVEGEWRAGRVVSLTRPRGEFVRRKRVEQRWSQSDAPAQRSGSAGYRRALGTDQAGGREVLQQFDSITERVVDIDPIESVQRLVLDDSISGAVECRSETPNVLDQEGGMGFPSRPELGLDAEMDPDVVVLEPAAPSLREVCRFLDLAQTETLAVERACGTFSTARHGQLDVVKGSDGHDRIIDEQTPRRISDVDHPDPAGVLGTGPELWMNLQVRYDMETAKRALGDRLSVLPVLNGVAA